ncbi:MAG: sulfur carrier protein ThiS adenylyltransferase ThiF [Candidatus Cloacimonetes bacterium]|nr:sulfur carrier protein ThiS adenylyltransferase ThiF [Candidatus Cloacimonadota bacterium]
METLKRLYFSKHDPALLPRIRAAVVGIAGAGGLGSNVAFSLARVGIGKLIIADYDDVEISNLNRQQYFIGQLGKPKVEALKENLEKINPFSEYEIYLKKISRSNIARIFGDCQILVEAFDRAEMKEMLIESWLEYFPDKPLVAASGLAGYGKNEALHTSRYDNVYICGDETSELPPRISPMAPRVALVANMQANLVLQLILEQK